MIEFICNLFCRAVEDFVKKIVEIILISVLLLGIIGCSTPAPSGKTEAEVLYKEALQLMDDGHYLKAIDKLNSIKSRHPYSYYAKHAELLQADILFKQENFVESAAAYILFKDFHPKYKKMGYVVWRIAESYFYQLPSSSDRDLNSGYEAIKYYDELLKRYSSSKFVKDAKERMKTCQKMIEDKDQYIADFYFRTEVYDAAVYRYLDILKNYKTKKLREHSMLRIVESSANVESFKDCVNYSNKYKSKISKPLIARIMEMHDLCKSKLNK